jgi:hypothetical protein
MILLEKREGERGRKKEETLLVSLIHDIYIIM